MEKVLPVPASVAQALMNYLATKPYAEVAQFIGVLSSIKVQAWSPVVTESAPPPPDTKADKKAKMKAALEAMQAKAEDKS